MVQPPYISVRHLRTPYALFWLLCALLVTLAALYMYFIMSSVVHVVLRQELAVSIQETHTEISELDAAYLAAHEAITKERAGELGLVALESVSYVTLDGPDTLTFDR